MNGKSIETKLEVLRDNLQRLAAIPQASFTEFAADFRNVDSALHRLQTSIRALIDVASYKLGRRGLARRIRAVASSTRWRRTAPAPRARPTGSRCCSRSAIASCISATASTASGSTTS